ncbi:cytochrome c oxidase subunit 4 isoform 2, mitochondrial [Ornithorhynchus anatinus]|uniref:cytochrome c oxidase subunit 4 isoform 2, mitochondrial n=1 Tax=Ornithorhynchus anatinus TaxID=9258 RepID=UPI0010A77259|nr:cytochrome c oxidase subunit 4 isoform 2, mitochondrial [Ornithorhynchus anatinus]
MFSAWRTLAKRGWWMSFVIRTVHGPGGPGPGEGVPGSPPPPTRRSHPLPYEALRRDLRPEERELKEKEKGAWTRLSNDEKVALYRLQFPQTLAEAKRPSGEWKAVLGGFFFFLGLTALMMAWQRVYVFPEKPPTLSARWKAQQLRRTLDMKANPVQGLASKWDYRRDQWKK